MTVVETRRFDALAEGDLWWSPAHRWETVTEACTEPLGIYTQIRTDAVAADYAWRVRSADDAVAIPAHFRRITRVVAVDETATTLIASLRTEQGGSPWDRDALVLAQAMPVRGDGWDVAHRPETGGDMVHTRVSSKATARTAVTRAARAHAKALGLPFRAFGGAA